MKTGLKWSDFKHVLTGVDVVEYVDVKEYSAGTPVNCYKLRFNGEAALSMRDLSSLIEVAGGDGAKMYYSPATDEEDSSFELWIRPCI